LRVIPVLDLRAGRAVLARGGRRETYAPVRSLLVAGGEAGDPLALARAYRDTLGCDEWYVADLDAIAGGAVQRAVLRGLGGLGGLGGLEGEGRLLVDAAVSSPERARELVADGADRVVVGLETLPSFGALAAVARAIGPERVAFSLDLRDGAPLTLPGGPRPGTPLELARAAVTSGAGAIIVLDLARVGSGRGIDAVLVEALRRAHRDVELLAGGGIGTARELERLADAGVDGALVATALHDGRISRDDVAAVRRADHPSDSR
jgi:phosphoribosylformimino-5-aminoimidazole carboxamide ribotide isomerase